MPRGSSILVLALFVASRAAGREASAGGAILVSPEAPVVGGPLRVVAVSDRPLDGTLAFVAPDGGELAATRERRGGPPYSRRRRGPPVRTAPASRERRRRVRRSQSAGPRRD